MTWEVIAGVAMAAQGGQEIVALRTDNSESDVIVAEGVSGEHRATDVLSVSR